MGESVRQEQNQLSKFENKYFFTNIKQLASLRNYFRTNPDLESSCLEDCVKLRINGIEMIDDNLLEHNRSLKTYINSLGGPSKFMELPIIVISPIVTAIAYVYLIYIRENGTNDIQVWDTSIERCRVLINKLYLIEIQPNDFRVYLLNKWCSQPTEQISATIDLFIKEMSPIDNETFEDVALTLRFFLNIENKNSVCI